MSEPGEADKPDVADAPRNGPPDSLAERPALGWPWRLLAKLARLALVLLVLAGVALAATWALLHGEWGTQQVLAHLPGVKVLAPAGALLGDFSAERIEVSLPREGRLVLVQPRWTALRLRWDGDAPWRLGAAVDEVRVARLELRWVPGPPTPSQPLRKPDDLVLPVSVEVGRLRVDEARSALWGEPIQGLDASMQAQRQGGHGVRIRSVRWAGWSAEGQAHIAADAPMQLDARVAAQRQSELGEPLQGAGAAWLRAKGPVDELAVVGEAVWQPAPVAASKAQEPRKGGGTDPQALVLAPPAQTLRLSAAVRPFAPWPLAAAQAEAQGLNLAGLLPGAPETDWRGAVSLQPTAVDKAFKGAPSLTLALDLRNGAGGAWDQGRLPVQSLVGRVVVDQGQHLAGLAELLQGGEADVSMGLPGVKASAVAAAPSASQVRLVGQWGRGVPPTPLRLLLQAVEPQGLHGAAPPLWLQGEVRLQPEALLAQGRPVAMDAWRARLDAQLQGWHGAAHAREVLDNAPKARAAGGVHKALPRAQAPARQAVSATLSSQLQMGRWSVSALSLKAADALAVLHDARVHWQQDKTGRLNWQTQGQLSVQRFDPQIWLPWPAGMGGRNSVSAQGRFALDSGWRGQADLNVLPSELAGLPLQGQAQWRSPTGPRVMSLSAQAEVAGNRAQVEGRLPWREDAQGAWQLDDSALPGGTASWQAKVSAPQIRALTPLAPLLGARQLDGSLQLDGQATGLWPPRQSQGSVQASRLQWLPQQGAAVLLQSLQGDWRVNLQSPDDPLQLRVQAQGLQAAGLQVDQIQSELSGSVKAHRLTVQGQGQRQMDEARGADATGTTGGTSGTQSGTGTAGTTPSPAVRLQLALDGGWQTTGQGEQAEHTWRGHLQQGSLRWVAEDGTPPPLQMQPVDWVWQQGPGGSRFTLQPARLQVLGAELRVERMAWQGADPRIPAGRPDGRQVEVLMRLEPLNLPQLLAKWQPQAGWGGDLTVGGQLSVRHSPTQPWRVEGELARRAGDLTLTETTIEGNTPQRLGIRDAVLSLQARDGLWTLDEHLDGRVFGLLSGRQRVQAAQPDALPDADSPLSGEVNLQVTSLRPLATWAPAGWRVGGQAQAQARLSGTVGAPKVTGWLEGEKLALSQSLLGVNLSDGQLRIDFDGAGARLSRFVAHDGTPQGLLKAEGEATLGSSPTLRVSAQAEHFALLQRVDRRIVVSAQTTAQLDAELIKVRGQVKVDEGLIDISRSDAPTLGDDVTVVNRKGGNGGDDTQAASQGGGGSQHKLDAELSLDLGNKLRLKGHGLDGFLVGQLQISTPNNKPAIKGAIRVDKGVFAAYGQKLNIERSTVTFTGLIENPRLDILAMRPQSPMAADDDVRVGVRITGTAQDPRVRLYSEPSLSETEQLSWLVLGRGPSGLGGADIGLLQTAAVALLSGDSGNPGPTDQLIHLLGLDTLSVRQTDGAVRDTVVAVGKQVSRFWYVGYERNLNATGGNWQLTYHLARRFRVRAQAGEDNAIDFIWQWRWD